MLAALAALGTGLAVYSYLAWLRSQTVVSGRLVPVVVATRDLQPGTVVEAGMVEVSRHPDHHMPRGALGSVDSALGGVVAVPIFQGDPVTAPKIGRGRGGSSAIPSGMRAYTLLVASGWGPAFRPKIGEVVDVIVTLPQEVLGEARSVTVAQSRRVAAVGSPPSRPGFAASRIGRGDPSGPALMITLFVTSEEAERLAMAEALGRVTVVLAPEDAEEDIDPVPVTPRDLGAR